MQTVVNKEIEGPKFSRQGSKISTARTFYELPPVIKLLAHRDSNLLAPVMFDGWQINAPELTGPVELQGFQDEAGRDAMSNSGLDNYLGFQMADQTPDRPDKAGSPSFPWKKLSGPTSMPRAASVAVIAGQRLVGSERAPHGKPITNSAWSRASQSLSA